MWWTSYLLTPRRSGGADVAVWANESNLIDAPHEANSRTQTTTTLVQ